MTPTYTVDDLVQATDRAHRTMQAAVRTYIRVTGDPVATDRQRNFERFLLTELQFTRIRDAALEVAHGYVSYEDEFQAYAGDAGPPATDPDATPLTLLQAQVDQMQEGMFELLDCIDELRGHLGLPALAAVGLRADGAPSEDPH